MSDRIAGASNHLMGKISISMASGIKINFLLVDFVSPFNSGMRDDGGCDQLPIASRMKTRTCFLAASFQ